MPIKALKRLNLALALGLVLVLALSPVLFTSTASAQAKKTLTWGSGKGDIPTMDPALVTDTSSSQMTTLLFHRLVKADEEDTNVILPGLFESWSISEDGLTYTFKVRAGIPWVRFEGDKVVKFADVSADDVVYGIMRTLDPRTASEYAYVFTDSLQIVGASEFNGVAAPEGKDFTDPDTLKKLDEARAGVGIKALDKSTVEVKIKNKIAYGLGIFTLINLAAQPKEAIEKSGDKWTEPENILTYGPYVLKEWKHEEKMTLVANPFWPGIEGSPKPAIEEIVALMIDTPATFANYEAGTVDISGVPTPEIDRVKADPTLSKELKMGTTFSSSYYGFNASKEPTNDVRVRRALSLAVDRQALIDTILKDGRAVAKRFTPPGLAGAPGADSEVGISYDPDAAKKELEAFLKEKGITADKMPPIALGVNQVEANIKLAEAHQAMWKETLGLDVKIQPQEWAVYLKQLDTDPPNIYRLGWSQDYYDANNYLSDVFRSTSSNNHTKWVNPEYDKLVDQAAVESDNAKRVKLYEQAEDILVNKDAVIIPQFYGARLSLSKPYVVRTFAAASGDERFEKWDLKK